MAHKRRYKHTVSRKTRNSLFTLVFVLILIFSVADRLFITKSITPKTTTQRAVDDFEKYHNKQFTVIYVVDGDTLDVDCADGNYKKTRIRFLGVDTPETKNTKTGIMYFGPEASEKTKKLTLNQNITILLDRISPTRDKYGRLLCYIKLADDKILNELLVEQGFAYADLRFQHSFFNKYKSIMDKARRKKIGLWKNVQPEQFPDWLKRIRPDW